MKKNSILLLLSALLMFSTGGFFSCSSDDDDANEDLPEEVTPPAVPAIALNKYCDGLYFGNFWDEGYADYYFIVTNSKSIGHLQDGTIVAQDEGCYVLYCDLWSAISKDHTHPILPEGTYTANKGRKNGTFNLDLTLATLTYEKVGSKGKIKNILFKDGTIVVKHEGQNYNIEASFKTTEDKDIRFSYVGPMEFSDQSDDIKTDNHIRQNLTPDFVKVTNQLFSDKNENYDNYLLRLFTTERVTDDGLYPYGEGVKLQLDLCVPKGGEIAGTYKIGDKSNLKAGDLYPGVWFGQQALGTFCMQTDAKMNAKFCALKSGEAKIVKNADGTYTINSNFVDTDGHTVKSSWTGNIEKYARTESVESTLTQDVEFFAIQCSEIGYFGDYYQNGKVNYNIIFANEDELLAIDLVADSGDNATFPTGVFKVGKDVNQQSVLPGKIDAESANPTCYVKYVEKNGELVASDVAPVVNGTLEVTKNGDLYAFKFNFLDDANRADASLKAHRIYGVWEGTLPVFKDYTQPAAPQAKSMRLQLK